MTGLTEDLLAADLRDFTFRPGPVRTRRIGAEIEVLPVSAVTGRMAPVVAGNSPATLPVLRRCAAEGGWLETDRGGIPAFNTPGGTVVSYEPGGQIELSSSPCLTVGELARKLRRDLARLRDAAEPAGIRLLSAGMHPTATTGEVPLQLTSERYRRMDRYFSRIGPAGARMMRLTAACQVNLDWGAEPARALRVLNAAAPLTLAIFANSPGRPGRGGEPKSRRSLVWQQLDPGRTGVLRGEPVASYLHFALHAGAILLGETEDAPRPFGEWVRSGAASLDDWHAHLTTLFPVVRPKGYAEVRCIDAVDPDWLEAPLVLLSGLLHPTVLVEADTLLGEREPIDLERAARSGLGDPEISRRAMELWDLALAGAAKDHGVDAGSLAEARNFADRFTRRGIAPADSTDA